MNPTPRNTPTQRRPLAGRSFRTASARLAGAFCSVLGLASSVHAASQTWDFGAATQDWGTAANWTNDLLPAAPAGEWWLGQATINTATDGQFPIISATPAFTPTDIIIGSGTGNTGRLDQTGGTASTGNGNWFLIGTEGGTGTFNLTGGAMTAQELHNARTGSTGTGTVNVSNATFNTFGATVIADGTNNGATAVGTMNLGAGATWNSEGDVLVSFAGGANTLGTLNLETGSVMNVASGTKRWFIMNMWDFTKGVVNVNGGTLNLNANADIQFSTGSWGPGASTGASTFNLNSGSVNGGAASVLNLNNNADNAVTSTLNLNGGTLTISQILSSKANGARVINFNGGTVRASAANTAFITATAASTANVLAGGVILDSNGFDIGVAKALTAGSGSTGGLTKLGAGALTLSGLNTYVGNTTISAGSLTLADNASLKFAIGASGVNNQITGTGSVTIDGDFDFDLASASTTLGDSWQIVDAALTETFGGTFTVTGFSASASKWVKPANGAFYEFDPATGALRVIADPGLAYPDPTATAGAQNTTYAVGSDIILSVSASGLGSLTYQWLLDGNPISGATGASLTVSAATAANNGVYSVVVTDHAAEASGQAAKTSTVTFSSIAVVPAADLAVAYYRFEEGSALATITTANDSAGTNHLTALGTPNFAEDSLPYSAIPATGASNTLGANFPATGNNGLIAPTTGTLADTAFSDFTVEAFVRLDSLSGWQTIVGRDDSGNPGQAAGGSALFYLSKSGANNGFRLELITNTGANLQINSTTVPTVGTWYHVAAVGNAITGTLKLYVNGTEVGSATGYTGLFAPATGTDAPWTIGRGDWAAGDVDFLRGDVDEVRFTRAALAPSQFLNTSGGVVVINPTATLAPAAQTLVAGSSTTLTATAASQMGGTMSYAWYKDGSVISGETGSTLTLTGLTPEQSGTYSVIATDSAGTTAGLTLTATASAVIKVPALPAAGQRTIALNFVGSSNGGSFSTELAPIGAGETAGFYATGNWNNSAEVNYVATQTTPLTLQESNGSTAAGVTATWSSANTWSARTGTGLVANKTTDGKLLHGYIESRSTSGATVTVTNIPYATYDVFVYVAGGGNGNVGSITLDRAGSTTYYYRPLQHDSYTVTPTPTVGSPYAPPAMISDATSRDAALAAAPATFVRFTGVSGQDLTVASKDQTVNVNAGGIAAIQIVDTTPAGTPYPPRVASAPVSRLVRGGSAVSLSASAVSNNTGGVITYQWQKDSADLPGKTSATLTIASAAGTDSGLYTVVVTDTSSLGVSSTTRSASLVVVDGTRSLLINGDLGTATASAMPYTGVMLTDGNVSPANVGAAANTWNNVATAAGSGSAALASESTGLAVSGLTLAYTGVGGSFDSIDVNDGAIDNSNGGEGAAASGTPLLRDLAYTDSQTTPMTFTVGGLQSFVGHRVKLVVYASGASSTFTSVANLNDAATISLDASNNDTNAAPQATANADGRDLRYNLQAYVAFEGVVSGEGTVTWNAGADLDGGRIPVNGFQLLVTGQNLGPAVPTGVAAVAGDSQVGLSWNAVSGATSYTIRRGTVSGAYTTLSAGTVTGTIYTDATAANGTTYYYTVAAATGALVGYDSAEVSATPVLSATALELWRSTHFGSTANSGNGADSADPDNDGQANLLEYALGQDPTVASASTVTLGRSGDHLTLTFTHGADASLVYTIEASNDLATWSTVETYPAFSVAGSSTYTDTAVSVSTQPRRFLRLRVALAP